MPQNKTADREIRDRFHNINLSNLPSEICEKCIEEIDRSMILAFASTSKENRELYKHVGHTEYSLRQAIINGATDTVILYIIDRIKFSPYIFEWGSALHCAVAHNSSMTVINYLIKKNKHATKNI